MHDAVLDLLCLGKFGDGHGLVERVCDGLLAIDVFAGLDRTREKIGAHLRGRGIEEHRVVRVLQCGIEIGGRTFDPVTASQGRNFFCITADQDGVWHYAVAVGQRHPTLPADGNDRALKVLVEPHAPGNAIHNDAEFANRHICLPLAIKPSPREA